ncbi:hypothetical protein ACIGD1_34550 [Streptomyces sp. NPDC085612]|uniref:hypothetical protein n=1 Tax=Streptomyces sp. NPDC085612 TaxID=3365732 RepID=UPI0037D60537
MSTTRLNRIAAAGTARRFVRIRLADSLQMFVLARVDNPFLEEVYLSPGITAPDTEDWEDQDTIELAGETGGHLYLDVPTGAVRALIEEHGGEHTDQDEDFPSVDYQLHPIAPSGHYPVTRGTQPIGRIARRTRDWHAIGTGGTQWAGPFNGPEQAAACLVAMVDLDTGRARSGEKELAAALAEHGLAPHRDGAAMYGTSWLTVGPGAGGDFPPMDEKPYVYAYLRNCADEGEMAVDRAVRAGDEWVTVVGCDSPDEDGPDEFDGRTFPGTDTAAVAAYIADWHRDPRAFRAQALKEARARRSAALGEACSRFI